MAATTTTISTKNAMPSQPSTRPAMAIAVAALAVPPDLPAGGVAEHDRRDRGEPEREHLQQAADERGDGQAVGGLAAGRAPRRGWYPGAAGPAPARDGAPGQVGGLRGQVGVGAGRVHPAQALVQLVLGEPALDERAAQHVRRPLPVGVATRIRAYSPPGIHRPDSPGIQ